MITPRGEVDHTDEPSNIGLPTDVKHLAHIGWNVEEVPPPKVPELAVKPDMFNATQQEGAPCINLPDPPVSWVVRMARGEAVPGVPGRSYVIGRGYHRSLVCYPSFFSTRGALGRVRRVKALRVHKSAQTPAPGTSDADSILRLGVRAKSSKR
ncbi:hypothetical protein CYMTET_36463 [Cymbomonas tetramitiformis]|uniref:CRIB domain-containing protein n=1 Tax=Cymbomonas tetramitiformis TaxID=36881 RepID=A0AAE0CG09_9CHLO|nr:hypothetical protein CYMTET_36463 [Cymbomonas tetramitiformis]